eukprot:TRINITY_DN82656_c0_g1_i1.p1 TRINITY_DN82656_c0_g1~~TRINITY_DN82656_c0_g1_i1.p1  ORF type:complete len:187 (-),score=30.37 TRINITY_DN82656_c0_g1_i1:60-620(-)
MSVLLFRLGFSSASQGTVRALATSALRLPSQSCWGTSKRTSAPLLPEGMDPRERHHCGPNHYVGKTPLEIVERFKDSSTFPWYQLPEKLRNRRFEELWQLAHRCGHKSALQAVQLLTDASHDRGAARKVQSAAAAPSMTGAAGTPEAEADLEPQRLTRSAKRALNSGTPAVPAFGKGPRATVDTEQ